MTIVTIKAFNTAIERLVETIDSTVTHQMRKSQEVNMLTLLEDKHKV